MDPFKYPSLLRSLCLQNHGLGDSIERKKDVLVLSPHKIPPSDYPEAEAHLGGCFTMNGVLGNGFESELSAHQGALVVLKSRTETMVRRGRVFCNAILIGSIVGSTLKIYC